jgi:hypothetical protein
MSKVSGKHPTYAKLTGKDADSLYHPTAGTGQEEPFESWPSFFAGSSLYGLAARFLWGLKYLHQCLLKVLPCFRAYVIFSFHALTASCQKGS